MIKAEEMQVGKTYRVVGDNGDGETSMSNYYGFFEDEYPIIIPASDHPDAPCEPVSDHDLARIVNKLSDELRGVSSPPQPEPTHMSRDDILREAAQAVTVDRAATHGDMEDNFSNIAQIWSVRLGKTVTTEQVAIMMVDLKTVRAWGNPGHMDNWVDMAGYAACGGEISDGIKD